LLAAGLVWLLLTWYRHTPPTLYGAGDLLTAVGRLTGLAAGYASAVLVLIMARLPVLERGVGADRLTRWHAGLGRLTVALVLFHGASVLTGYALAARVPLWTQAERLLLHYPYVWWAVAAGVLLVLAGVLSARAVLRRVGYERWYLLHLLTYVAVALAFAHEVSDGADLLYDPAAQMAWSVGWAVVAGCVLVFRVGRPAAAALRHGLRVSEVVPEAPGVVSLLLAGRQLDALRAEPGQFVRLRPLTRAGWWQAHPFSLSAPSSPTQLRVTVKAVGNDTAALHALAPGTRVLVEGPYGTFTARRLRRPHALLIAGGIGITPLRALFETLPATRLTLMYLCRNPAAAVFREELDRIAADRGARLVYVNGSASFAESLAELVAQPAELDAYLCGPPALRHAAAAGLRAAGVPRRRIHQESFGLPRAGARGVALPAAAGVATLASLALLAGPRVSWHEPAARGRAAAAAAPRGSLGAARRVNATHILGPAERTLFSTVQVEVTVTAGRLTGVRAVALPDLDAHSRELSATAAPLLRREALASAGRDIRVVSGATYTSTAYAESLQGALDRTRVGRR
jgi:predicted ferric reductase/uncharacterized protein with FMN-binding domain